MSFAPRFAVSYCASVRPCPSPSQIKAAVERLIEGDYLERDADDSKLLKYLA